MMSTYSMGERYYGAFKMIYGDKPQENEKRHSALVPTIVFRDFAPLSL